ncbi:MAG: PadR family transcriptional regulator [Actinomycetota bacterium]|nr:PadR family transcriptional regulator [Actinomycetota bacterium]
MKELTTTSYAILGLLAVQPWTTYELARQMEVSLHNFWPRAERKLYEEPKKLVDHGFAEVAREMVGRRPRSLYRITAEGRRALRQWLGEPGAMPVLEFEALVKVFFAEQGTRGQLLATLQHIQEGAEHRQRIDARWAAYYLATGGGFPHRAQVVTLVGKLQAELNNTLAAWARWAHDTVTGWPDDISQAPVPLDVLREIATAADDDIATGTAPPGYDEIRR